MARGKYITEFEKDAIRVGVANGHPDLFIAAFLQRSRPMVTAWRLKMQEDGSIDNMPFGFVAERISGEMIEAKADR